MIRLRRDDFEDPHELAKFAATVGISLEEFRASSSISSDSSRRRWTSSWNAVWHRSTLMLFENRPAMRSRGLILYHASLSLRPAVDSERSAPATLLREMSPYAGRVVIGRDLDVY